ncbi:hypothetical protein VTK26DRAFT_2017 [Humicola hyalothermophila]
MVGFTTGRWNGGGREWLREPRRASSEILVSRRLAACWFFPPRISRPDRLHAQMPERFLAPHGAPISFTTPSCESCLGEEEAVGRITGRGAPNAASRRHSSVAAPAGVVDLEAHPALLLFYPEPGSSLCNSDKPCSSSPQLEDRELQPFLPRPPGELGLCPGRLRRDSCPVPFLD